MGKGITSNTEQALIFLVANEWRAQGSVSRRATGVADGEGRRGSQPPPNNVDSNLLIF